VKTKAAALFSVKRAKTQIDVKFQMLIHSLL